MNFQLNTELVNVLVGVPSSDTIKSGDKCGFTDTNQELKRDLCSNGLIEIRHAANLSDDLEVSPQI